MKYFAWLLVAVPLVAQDDRGKVTPEMLRERKEQAYKDAEEAAKKWKVWTAAFSLSFPEGEDSTRHLHGSAWVQRLDEKSRRLFWEGRYTRDPEGAQPVNDGSRSLLTGKELLVTAEKEKILQRYALEEPVEAFIQVLATSGFSRDLETLFEVEIAANAKHMKTEEEVTLWDIQQHGKEFKSLEDLKKYYEGLTAKGSGGAPTNLKEMDPFKEKRKEFEEREPRNKPPDTQKGPARKYYLVYLTPREKPLKERVRQIALILDDKTFLPLSIMIDHKIEKFRTASFRDHAIDPKPEVKDERFVLDAAGYTVVDPLKDR